MLNIYAYAEDGSDADVVSIDDFMYGEGEREQEERRFVDRIRAWQGTRFSRSTSFRSRRRSLDTTI